MFGMPRNFHIVSTTRSPFVLGREDDAARGIFGACMPFTTSQNAMGKGLKVVITRLPSGEYVIQNRGSACIWIEKMQLGPDGKRVLNVKMLAPKSGLYALRFGSRIRVGNVSSGGVWYKFNAIVP